MILHQHKDFIEMVKKFLRQEKDSIEEYKRALRGQSNSASPTRGFEKASFTECRHSPRYHLQSLIHYGSAVIGVEATPSMAGFLTSSFASTPWSFIPSIQDSEQPSASHVLQTFIPQQEVSLQGSNDINSPPESPPMETLGGQDVIDLLPPWSLAETNIGIFQPAAGIFSQDHYDRQPIDPDNQEGGTSSIHQDPVDIFIIALTYQYLRFFAPENEPTDRQVEFLIHQARAASSNEF